MKKITISLFAVWICLASAQAQITPLNNNESMTFLGLLNNTKGIFYSKKTNRLWVSNGTAGGTTAVTNKVLMSANGASATMNGKLYFAGNTADNGVELWVTDGTDAGTNLVKDINPGVAGSMPADRFLVLNNQMYFSAFTSAHGRELWKSDGTTAGTVMIKDIVPGTGGSNQENFFKTTIAGNQVFFIAHTPGAGEELWRTDGTDPGTYLVKDINPGSSSSIPFLQCTFNNKIVFSANDGTHDREPWISDGTAAGTILLKDISTGPLSSSPDHFIVFKSKVLFAATDFLNGQELWETDGTAAGTKLLKDIEPGIIGSAPLLVNGIKTMNKYYFTAYTTANGQEIWETDGTTAGTRIFADIEPGNGDSYPILMPAYANGFANPGLDPLFQGNKFFFSAFTTDKGRELYTFNVNSNSLSLVKNLDNNINDGVAGYWYYISNSALYFCGYDGTNNGELFKTDGTATNTSLVGSIRSIPGFADVQPFIIINNSLLFTGDNGDDPTNTYIDLYRVDAPESPLPLTLLSFRGHQLVDHNLLNWDIAHAVNVSHFEIERSFNGQSFNKLSEIPWTPAATQYQFTDHDLPKGQQQFYYRLRIKDMDGSSSYSDILRLQRISFNDQEVNIYRSGPGSISIQYTLPQAGAIVKICDLNGRTLSVSQLTSQQGSVIIPVNQPAANMIIVTVAYGNVLTSKKIVWK